MSQGRSFWDECVSPGFSLAWRERAAIMSSPIGGISRHAALARKDKYYFTGKPCSRGHILPRLVCSCVCVECGKKNGEVWHRRNPEKVRLSRERHAAAYPEKVREQKSRWERENKHKIKARKARYRAENPDLFRAKEARRRARKRAADGNYTAQDVLHIYRSQRGKCAYCKVKLGKKYHVDHIIPLFLGGSNWPNNLQLLCAPCNVSKGAIHPVDFARKLGRLL